MRRRRKQPSRVFSDLKEERVRSWLAESCQLALTHPHAQVQAVKMSEDEIIFSDSWVTCSTSTAVARKAQTVTCQSISDCFPNLEKMPVGVGYRYFINKRHKYKNLRNFEALYGIRTTKKIRFTQQVYHELGEYYRALFVLPRDKECSIESTSSTVFVSNKILFDLLGDPSLYVYRTNTDQSCVQIYDSYICHPVLAVKPIKTNHPACRGKNIQESDHDLQHIANNGLPVQQPGPSPALVSQPNNHKRIPCIWVQHPNRVRNRTPSEV
jgi:hypothetical protein